METLLALLLFWPVGAFEAGVEYSRRKDIPQSERLLAEVEPFYGRTDRWRYHKALNAFHLGDKDGVLGHLDLLEASFAELPQRYVVLAT